MIRAKRLEWEETNQSGPVVCHVSRFGCFHYMVTRRDFNDGFEADLRVGAYCYKPVGRTYQTADAAKDACQNHANALAREIAEVVE